MAKTKRILVFTGGGPAPALNATVAGVISQAKQFGFEVLGGIGGWGCIAKEGGRLIRLDNLDIDLEKMARFGGTFLRTSRTNPLTEKGGVERVKENLKRHQINGIVAIGGDDTLGAASRLFSKFGLPIVGAPKTIDNDLDCTYWTPGFPTAAQRLIQFTKAVRQVAYATRKIHIIECFGGNAGWLCASANLGGARVIVVPEKVTLLDKLIGRVKELYQQDGYVVVAISHAAKFSPKLRGTLSGRKDPYKHQREYLISLDLQQRIARAMDGKVDVKLEIPSYYLMGADPIEVDREVAWRLGENAVWAIEGGFFGQISVVVSRRATRLTSLSRATGKYRSLDETRFNFEAFVPKQSFVDYIINILGPQDIGYDLVERYAI
jgi:6-phosphofructokinase 1